MKRSFSSKQYHDNAISARTGALALFMTCKPQDVVAMRVASRYRLCLVKLMQQSREDPATAPVTDFLSKSYYTDALS